MAGSEIDLGVLTNRPEILSRAKKIAEEYEYSFVSWESLDQFSESKSFPSLILVFLDGPDGKPLSAPELAQTVRFSATEPYLICTTSDSIGKDEAAFAKKSGANLILLEDEILNSGKLEFVCTQVLRSKFMPIKSAELIADIAVTFDLYHLMPQRKKFLKIALAGDVMEGARIQKLMEVGELYFDRKSAPLFNAYIIANTDRSAAGLRKRCRSQFLALFEGFSQLVFQLTDQSEKASFGEGQEMLKKCKALCSELLGTLAEFGNAWDVINNSAIGSFGSVERAPAIAAYAGLFALQVGIDSTDELMLCALLADLGLLFLSPNVLKKIREGTLNEFTADELAAFRRYPEKSLQIILDRKLSLSEKLRLMLTSTQERADGSGFPKGLVLHKIPKESQIIGFCREFDRNTLVQMGKARKDPKETLLKMLTQDPELASKYSMDWTEELRKFLTST